MRLFLPGTRLRNGISVPICERALGCVILPRLRRDQGQQRLGGRGSGTIEEQYDCIDSITVVRKGIVRRAKLYYLRGRTGKRARIAERRDIRPGAEAGQG